MPKPIMKIISEIKLFPTLCKIYEMILLNRLEKFAIDNEYFSELQFGFREGLFFNLFSELGINGRMSLVIKDLHTNVKEKVLYAGALSSEIDIL